MVIYDLSCGNSHRFEGWFENREDFERQLNDGLIECPLCGSCELTEKPTAPALHFTKRTKQLDKRTTPKPTAVAAPSSAPTLHADKTALRALTDAVKSTLAKHFDNVGQDFASEALAIHVGDSEPRNIHGTMTPDEETELKDCGVPYQSIRLPRFDD